MSKTHISVNGEKFFVNNKLVYSEIEGSNPSAHGLLMNARFIQGIFDDKADPQRFHRFGKGSFNPDKNTDDLIAALPEWYSYGLRAFTVGLQGGGPCFTIEDFSSIENNPFGADGKQFDSAYKARLEKLIHAADNIGMAVIVSILYQGQAPRLKDGQAVRNAVKTACTVLKNMNYSNIIIEVANEHHVGKFNMHPIVHSAEGAAYLVELARECAPGIPVGCSGGGGYASREIAEVSDIIFIHGNGCTRQQYYNLVKKVQSWDMNKPIVCNEDSPCIGQLQVAYSTETSWGYYNNLTKQEPPADWRVTKGEDTFFARRMAEGIGIKLPAMNKDEQFYLQGFETDLHINGERWIRLASLYPELIDHVEFYKNAELIYTVYDEPFMLNTTSTWTQESFHEGEAGTQWEARICLRSGEVITKTIKV